MWGSLSASFLLMTQPKDLPPMYQPRPSSRALVRAARPVLETLEARQLLHGGFAAQVNFGPAPTAMSPVPDGYVQDSGAVYADRGNGLTYGWNADDSANTRDRQTLPDQR